MSSFWSYSKLHGSKTLGVDVLAVFMFWSYSKLHGSKTSEPVLSSATRFADSRFE